MVIIMAMVNMASTMVMANVMDMAMVMENITQKSKR